MDNNDGDDNYQKRQRLVVRSLRKLPQTFESIGGKNIKIHNHSKHNLSENEKMVLTLGPGFILNNMNFKTFEDSVVLGLENLERMLRIKKHFLHAQNLVQQNETRCYYYNNGYSHLWEQLQFFAD